MKILDKYVAKNFLFGYLIAFCVLVGLRIVIDLFINLDEFTEHADLGTVAVLRNIFNFYAINTTMYFRDFAGMIVVVAAAFSLGKMTKNNELVAVMASGLSLKRLIAPIVFLALILTGFLIIDQEILIPKLADKIVREHEVVPGEETYDVWFIRDSEGSLICSQNFNVKNAVLNRPTIITRRQVPDTSIWEVTGRIVADQAIYNFEEKRWDMVNGVYYRSQVSAEPTPVASYQSNIEPKDIPIMRQARNLSLLGSRQLTTLAKQKTKDMAQLYSEKHSRVTGPIINMIMLMICLPILVCRDPKAMKSAIAISFAMTLACFIASFLSKMLAAEAIFGRMAPQLWAWMPVFVFLPISIMTLDSMKT